MNLFLEPNGKIVGQWKGNNVRIIDAAMFNKNESGVVVVRDGNKLLLVKGGFVIANVTQEGFVSEIRSYPYSWKPKAQMQESVAVNFSDYTTEVDNFFKELKDYDPFKIV